MTPDPRQSQGFIALYSVLVISGLLSFLVASAGTAAYLVHQAAVDEYSYRTAQQAAFSCARLAFARLSADPFRFVGLGTTTLLLSDTVSCGIANASTSESSASAAVYGASGESLVSMYATAVRITATGTYRMRTWTQK